MEKKWENLSLDEKQEEMFERWLSPQGIEFVSPDAEKLYKERLGKMIGILLNGFVHYNLKVKQAAFRVIGKEVFGSKHLSLNEKNYIFQLIAKKILTLLAPLNKEGLMFLINCIGLSYLYEFISDYNFFKDNINLKIPSKIATYV